MKSWVISLTNLWKGNFRMSSAEVFWKWRMPCRATVPALYLWGFTCLPASSPHVSSSSANQSSPTRGGPARFSLSCVRCRVLVAFCQWGGQTVAFLHGSLWATIGFGGAFPPPVFLRLLGSSSSPLSSWPRFLPLVPPTPPLLVLGPSPSHALPVVFFLPALVPSASSGPSSSLESSSP